MMLDNDSTAALVPDTVIQTSRVTMSRHGIVADTDIEVNVIVSELFGELTMQAKYKADHANTYFISAKPRQFVFFFQLNFLNLCLDARKSKHNSRYIKFTDDPNGRLAVILASQDDAESPPKFGIVTTRQIHAGEAITIGWWRPSITIEVVSTYWSSKRKPNGEKLDTVRQLCIWNGNSSPRRFSRRLVWNEFEINAVENMIMKMGSNHRLVEAWNQALYDLGFRSFNGWYSDGVTGVEIQTTGESDIPTLAIYKDEEETINYPLVSKFREIYPQYDIIDDLQYEIVRPLRTPVDLVLYKNAFHALKIIHKPDNLELFLKEASALVNLSNSPYVTRLTAFASMANPYDPNGDDVVCGLLMEFCEKGDLQALLQVEDVKNIPWPLKLKWAKQIALGVQDIHSLGLIHGDLKCRNIVIDTRGNAKVLDVCSGGMTHGYFRPSDANNEPLSPSFDIYSLGVIFWELSETETPQFRVPPVLLDLECPQRYADVVKKCVAESSRDRPPISEVIADINYIEETYCRRHPNYV
jgi:serine/threonine protein kinase